MPDLWPFWAFLTIAFITFTIIWERLHGSELYGDLENETTEPTPKPETKPQPTATQEPSLEQQYNSLLSKTKELQNDCSETIAHSERNHRWLWIMYEAYKLDKKDAEYELDFAKAYRDSDEFVLAIEHVQNAHDWFAAYDARLQTIYSAKNKGKPAPPVPVIAKR